MNLLRQEIDPLFISLVCILLPHLGNLKLFFEHIHLLLIIIWFFLCIFNLVFQHLINVMELWALNRRSLLVYASSILLEYHFLSLLVHKVHLMKNLDCCISVILFKAWANYNLTDILNETRIDLLYTAIQILKLICKWVFSAWVDRRRNRSIHLAFLPTHLTSSIATSF